jgi:2-dehydropantoate 2-reductase
LRNFLAGEDRRDKKKMKILVYGAGVIGSIYAARLQEAGYTVSLLARGERAVSLRTQGILLEDASTGHRTTTQVSLVDHLAPTDSYDVVIVTVRLDQLPSILPILAANHQIPTILFMLNNPDSMQRLEMLEPHRVLLGFPSIGGSRQGELIRYTHHPALIQTTLGKEDGRVTPRLRQLTTAFKNAGFSVALNSDMPSWLKMHAVIDVCMWAAVVMTQGGSAQLGRTRKHVVMIIQSAREGLQALRAQGIPIMPLSMKVLFLWMPRWLAVLCLQYALQSSMTLALNPNVQGGLDEARQTAKDIMAQIQKSSFPTPTLSHLMAFLEIPA